MPTRDFMRSVTVVRVALSETENAGRPSRGLVPAEASFIGSDSEFICRDAPRMLVRRGSDCVRTRPSDRARIDIGIEFRRYLVEIDELGRGSLAHLDGGKRTGTASRALNEACSQQELLHVGADIAPGRVGFGEAVLLAGEGVAAIDAL